MSVSSGSLLSHYRIGEKIGAGGMGEVWKAIDTRLHREVALKVLPAAFTRDPERLERFQREARFLASVNHPNIATIHGLEESDGTAALVMELVAGEDLAQRLARGPVPLDETLPIAGKIADALDYAHERGIVHRDLKPANVKITPDGQVKILDFGLAKVVEADPLPSGSESPSLSPTLAVGNTAAGAILGTAAYMSPEQAKGKPIDRRADVWAFGCVLYEMLSGRRAFGGETVPETLASVLKDEPDWSALPPTSPRGVTRVLRRCLEKNPAQRLRSAGDAALGLLDPEEPLSGGAPAPASRRGSAWLPWGIAALLAAALVGVLAARPATAIREGSRSVEIAIPEGHALSDEAPPAISPDGKWIVFASSQGVERRSLWLRSLESFEPTPVPGTDGAIFPFWAPDSRHVGYFSRGELRQFDLSTGNSQVVCVCAPWGRGGTWLKDGTILFAPSSNSGILSVPASGGEPVSVTEPDPSIPDASYRFPVKLPDEEHFLFTFWSNSREAAAKVGGIYVATRLGGEPRKLMPDASGAVFAPPASLLFYRGGQLVAVPFDARALSVGTEAVPVSRVVRFTQASGAVFASASGSGAILFAAGEGAGDLPLDLMWLDRAGSARPATDRPLKTVEVDLSPDGRRFVASVTPPETGSDDLWVGEFARGTLLRLTSGINASMWPRWSPDGAWIGFTNSDSGNEDIYRLRADGTGAPERIFDAAEVDTHLTDWAPDGRSILFQGSRKAGRRSDQIWRLDIGTGKAEVVLGNERASMGQARLSPDGRWIAYVSDESGQNEVFVRSYPALDAKWQLSKEGGTAPHWRDDGREITFVSGNIRVFAVPVAPEGGDLGPGVPELLFTAARALAVFAPAPDHSRFLSGTLPAGHTEPPLRLILGWGGGTGAGR